VYDSGWSDGEVNRKEGTMKSSVIAELKVIPLGTQSASLSKYVAAVINVVKQAKGITCQVTPMATIV